MICADFCDYRVLKQSEYLFYQRGNPTTKLIKLSLKQAYIIINYASVVVQI